MRSFISSAVLATAIFGEAAMSASIAHPHAHFHQKKAESVEKRTTHAFMDPTDVSMVQAAGVLLGTNNDASTGAPLMVGGNNPFTIELKNSRSENIVAVVWEGAGYDISFVKTITPNVTHTIQPGTSTQITFKPYRIVKDPNNPNAPPTTEISGALSFLYQGGPTISSSWQINNTWVEYTFVKENVFSTVDISRLINGDGDTVQVETMPAAGQEAKCTATMTQCAYYCAAGQAPPCMQGLSYPCDGVNTVNPASTDGGCAGMNANAGYTLVTFS